MGTFFDLLMVFLYFKIARVYHKEEKYSISFIIQHLIVAISSVILFRHAFLTQAWYVVGIETLVAFIAAALMITAVQLGIFVDGKPLFGMKRIYQNLYLLTAIISLRALFSL